MVKQNCFPKVIEIQTNTSCNARCSVCPHEKIYPKLISHCKLSTDIIWKVINEISEHNINVDRVIPYWNNEPFLDIRMMDILRYLKKKGLRCEVSTNMSQLKKEDMDEILTENLIYDFRISFFSAFESIYKKIMPGLVFTKNVEKIRYLLGKYYEIMPDQMKITINQVSHNEFNFKDESNECIRLFGDNINYHVFGYLDRAGSNSQKNNLTIESNNYLEQEVLLNGCLLKRAEEWVSITASGDVVICSQDWKKEIKYGNIYHDSVEDIFNGEIRRKTLQRVYSKYVDTENFICARCKLCNLRKRECRLANEIDVSD